MACCANEYVKEKQEKEKEKEEKNKTTLAISLSTVVLNSRDRPGNLWLP